MGHNKEENKPEVGLERKLGLFDSIMIVIGIVIGSGIFLTTGIMAKFIPSPGLVLLAWAVGGLLSLAGALAYAELGAAMPEAGGHSGLGLHDRKRRRDRVLVCSSRFQSIQPDHGIRSGHDRGDMDLRRME